MANEILVLGGGFAGIAALNTLSRRSDCTVRLVDRREDSFFAPLLPDLISRRIRPDYMKYPLPSHCARKGAEFVHAEVQRIDPDSCTVQTDRGELTADAIVLCLGCETNYFGNETLRENTIGLKTVQEGETITARAEQMLRVEKPVNMLVVGGGYTGFEAASHLALLVKQLTGTPYDQMQRVARIRVLEIADQPLRNIPEHVRMPALELLAEYGVEMQTGNTVEHVDSENRATLKTGEEVRNALVVWTPGVKAGGAALSLVTDDSKPKRLEVNEHLQVRGTQRVFAAGDVAAAKKTGRDTPLRMSVQFSLTGGRTAAENAYRQIHDKPLQTYNPFDPGYLLPLGPGRAAGVVLGKSLVGRLPLGLHYFMCSYRSWGNTNKLGVITDLLKGSTQ